MSPDDLDGGQGPPVRLRDGAPFSLAVFLGVRLLLSLTAVLAVGTVSPPSSAAAGGEVAALPGWHNAIDGTDRWDAAWFERIAGGGYAKDDAGAAFFPGYPLLIRATTWTTTLGEANAALLVADLSFLGALIVLFGLTRRYYPDDHARRTVVLIACFPASFFFLAPYSESPYLLASLLAFWWARDRRWGAAAIAGTCAAATRSIGVLLVPALLVEAWRQGPEGRGRRLAWATAPLLGPLAYAAYWWVRVGDPLRPFHAQAAWLRTFQAFPITLGRALRLGLVGIGDPRGVYWTADLLLTVILVTPLLARWRAIPTSYLVYAGVTILVILSYPLPARPLLSAPRLLLVVFPLFWAMAALFRGRLFVVATATFLLGFVALSAAFMNWGFVF